MNSTCEFIIFTHLALVLGDNTLTALVDAVQPRAGEELCAVRRDLLHLHHVPLVVHANLDSGDLRRGRVVGLGGAGRPRDHPGKGGESGKLGVVLICTANATKAAVLVLAGGAAG